MISQKIIIFIFIIIILIIIYKFSKLEYSQTKHDENIRPSQITKNDDNIIPSQTKHVDKIIPVQIKPKFEYTYNYTDFNDVDLNEKAYTILNEVETDHKKIQYIENMIMTIYHDANTNNELKEYLVFTNHMNKDRKIFFSDENYDVYLFNKIKILLILIPENNLEL